MQFNFFIFFESKERRRVVLYVFLLLCALLFVIDFFMRRHAYFDVESNYNFYSFYGFVMFSAIIFGSRLLRRLLGRSEDYYGNRAVDAEEYKVKEK